MFSFARRKPSVDLCPYVRRICDLTTPNLPNVDSSGRTENRSNRTIPTLLCPWENRGPAIDECTSCLTSDLSDRGVRLVLTQPLHAQQVVLGYWIDEDDMEEPWFFLADVRRCQAVGGGFWNLGVELTDLAHVEFREEVAPLREFATQLLPPLVRS